MSSARAQANHKLYLAKIQHGAWRQALDAQQIAAITLDQAFLPAVREHLQGAYGWFLLAVSGNEQLPAKAPRRCSELPPVAAGMAVAGEILEFQKLEAQGWLAAMLAEPDDAARVERSPGNLANATSELPGAELAGQWIEQLETLFERMSNSLDEY